MDNIEHFWRDFVTRNPDVVTLDTPHTVEQLGCYPEESDEEVQLILEGMKNTACGVLWAWDLDQTPFPEVGQITVVLDGRSQPRCIIQATNITILPFNEMEQHYLECGLSDAQTVAQFCAVYWRYFTRSLEEIGRRPSPNMPVVCEEFELLYAPEIGLLRALQPEARP